VSGRLGHLRDREADQPREIDAQRASYSVLTMPWHWRRRANGSADPLGISPKRKHAARLSILSAIDTSCPATEAGGASSVERGW